MDKEKYDLKGRECGYIITDYELYNKKYKEELFWNVLILIELALITVIAVISFYLIH